MKLASYKDGSRDGQLVVVSRDLTQAHYASHIASRLQQVLDDWNFLAPQIQEVYDTLNAGRARHPFPFDPLQCMAPLPRAYQWIDGCAYPPDMPTHFEPEPMMRQRGSDALWGPCDPIVCASEDLGIDFEAEIAVVTGDIPMGCSSDRALDGIRLLMLVNDVTLRKLVSAEAAKGWGLVQSKPATAFSPVAITPDELGNAWSKGRLHLPLQSAWNGRKVGMCDAGSAMPFHFGQLIAQVCKTRPVRAGSLIGSGAIGNPGVEKKARTEFMKFGDTIRIEMKGPDGQSMFGAIEQEVAPRSQD